MKSILNMFRYMKAGHCHSGNALQIIAAANAVASLHHDGFAMKSLLPSLVLWLGRFSISDVPRVCAPTLSFRPYSALLRAGSGRNPDAD